MRMEREVAWTRESDQVGTCDQVNFSLAVVLFSLLQTFITLAVLNLI